MKQEVDLKATLNKINSSCDKIIANSIASELPEVSFLDPVKSAKNILKATEIISGIRGLRKVIK